MNFFTSDNPNDFDIRMRTAQAAIVWGLLETAKLGLSEKGEDELLNDATDLELVYANALAMTTSMAGAKDSWEGIIEYVNKNISVSITDISL